jgi:hypothetical protein
MSKQQADLSGFCQIGFGILHEYIESLKLQLCVTYPEFIKYLLGSILGAGAERRHILCVVSIWDRAGDTMRKKLRSE